MIARLFAMLLLLGVVGVVSPAKASSCFAFSTDLNFGNIDMLSGSPADTSDTLFVLCFASNPANVVRACVHVGYNAANSTQRFMDNGSGDLLAFQIYKNAARTQIWGSANVPIPAYNTYGPVTMDFTPGTFFNSVGIYGRVFAGQTALPQGLYTTQLAGGAVGFVVKSQEYPSFGAAASCNAITTNSFTYTSTARANILATCGVSASTLDFGTVGNLASTIDGSAIISVSCTNGATYNVGLNGGTSGAIDPTMRQMSVGAENITYGLYRDAARSLAWGNSVGTNTVSGSLAGSGVNNHTVYGRVPVQATPTSGTYVDTVIITLTY